MANDGSWPRRSPSLAMQLGGEQTRSTGSYLRVPFELYFHPGHDDIEWWKRTHFDDDKEKYFDLWCSVIGQIGEQYGLSVAGYWFDDATFTYYPFNAPWAKMAAASPQGNPDRLVSYNSWILPQVSDFYEVFAGENDFSEEMIDDFGFLPVDGTGKFTGGPQSGLQGHITTIINGDWGHFKVNTPISLPRYSPDTMIAKLRDAISRRNVPTFDVEVYQDGRSHLRLSLFSKRFDAQSNRQKKNEIREEMNLSGSYHKRISRS